MTNVEKKFWFRRKWFGWGWYPATWQGWAIILVYIGLIVFFANSIEESSSPREVLATFIIPAVFLTAILIRLCYRTGEKPRWQWGKPDKNNEQPTTKNQ